MMFRLRSNDVAPTGRNDVPFVRDKRYFYSVGEGFPLPPIIAKITVCSLSVGDGAFSSEILTAQRAVSPALRLGFDCATLLSR